MKHKANAKVEVLIIKEGDIFVAYCPSLNLTTQGDTFESASKAFDEALDIFIEEVIEKGTLDEVLHDCGWTKVRHQWTSPTVVDQITKSVALPA